MLENARYHATLPASIFERAKAFCADQLGFTPVSGVSGGAFYESQGTRFLPFPSSGVASGTHAQVGFGVDDIAATVGDLEGRASRVSTGRQALRLPATCSPLVFRDSEGNLLGIAVGYRAPSCWSINRARRHHPFARLARDGRDEIEVRIVMKHTDVELLGRGGNEEIWDLAAALAACR